MTRGKTSTNGRDFMDPKEARRLREYASRQDRPETRRLKQYVKRGK